MLAVRLVFHYLPLSFFSGRRISACLTLSLSLSFKIPPPLEGIMLNEISQRKTNTYDFTHVEFKKQKDKHRGRQEKIN